MPFVSGLKVEMGTVAASGISSQSDHFTCFNYLSAIHYTFGEVSIVGFQSVRVADYYQIAVTAGSSGAFRETYYTVERGSDGISRFERKSTPLCSLVLRNLNPDPTFCW